MFQSPDLKSFFEDLASAFARGDVAAAIAPFQTPASISVAEKSLYVEDKDQALTVMMQYRANLKVEGYARTMATLHHTETAPDGTVRVLLTWTHLNRSGAEISHLDASYFLRPSQTGWVIFLIEVTSQPIPRLAAGLPIH